MLMPKPGMRVVRKTARWAKRHASSFNNESIKTAEEQNVYKSEKSLGMDGKAGERGEGLVSARLKFR
jgi:hypothetical protein